jgi:hypothetical protein
MRKTHCCGTPPTHLKPHGSPSAERLTLTLAHLVGAQMDIFPEQLADIIAEQ